MRYRPLIALVLCSILIGVPSISAQKRVFATVAPNASAININADIYDPASGKFVPVAGQMVVARASHAAIELRGGKVLVAGGFNDHYLNSAEIFDPATGLFTLNQATTIDAATGKVVTSVGSMNTPRSNMGAVALPSGRVLLAGGFNGTILQTAETYDPSNGVFTTTINSMNSARQDMTATLLNDGTVLLAGGFNGSFLNTAEVYSPSAGTFTATSGTMTVARQGHTATLLPNGTVLIVGGHNNTTSSLVGITYLDSAEIFDPATGKFTATGTLTAARSDHTASLLPGGKVVIAGGFDGKSFLNSAEVFDPSTGKFTATSAMTAPRNGHTSSTLPDGRILIAGGFSDHFLNGGEIFDPASNAFTALSSTMSSPRALHTATTLDNGSILFTGGRASQVLTFDVNADPTDNVAPNIVFSSDSRTGFVPYTGSGVILAFSAVTGAEIGRIQTGGFPAFITSFADGHSLAAVSVLDNRIFVVDTDALAVKATYSFKGAEFGFGSRLTLSPDGSRGYVSSTGTGEVIKLDMTNGNELGRLKDIQAPAQITLTPDGNTLIVIDTTAEQLIFANAQSMTALSYKVTLQTAVPTADLSIASRVVLTRDGSAGLIAAGDLALAAQDTAFIFKVSTGEILDTQRIGSTPGFSTITPDGQNWVVLNQDSISIIPTGNPANARTIQGARGTPLSSATMAVSSDSQFAFYPGSDFDLVFQHDLVTGGVIGQTTVGDSPNVSHDQPSAMAITPDGKTIAALNFISNQLDLLTDATALSQTKFISQQDQFTGVTLINLSNKTTHFTLTALTATGLVYLPSGVVNPVTVQVGPNAQVGLELTQVFNFDNTVGNLGWLTIAADQPAVAAFGTIGRIHPSFLGGFVDRLDGMPFYTGQLHDWIIPEVSQQINTSVELDFVNPNFNASAYDLTRFSPDGTILQTKIANVSGALAQTTQQIRDVFTVPVAGDVLIVGGADANSTKNTAETFHPATQSFGATPGSMTTPRQGQGASLLRNGKVLITGGKNGNTIVSAAETFDPIIGTFSATIGSMVQERFRHTSTILNSGKVLLAGGQNSVSVNKTAELYDPTTGSFSLTSSPMTSARDRHTAVLLQSGRVLLAGGLDGNATTATAEIYDPADSSFSSTGGMSVARAFHTAIALANGQVLVAGGFNGAYLDSVEIFDPSSARFSSANSMAVPRSAHTSTLLADGTILFTGGTNSSGTLNSAEIFDPASGVFSGVGTMTSARTGHTATLLPDGRVLIVGGTDGTTVLNSAELYDPINQTFTKATGTLNSARQGHTATFLEAGAEGYLRITSNIGHTFSELFTNGKSGAAFNGIDMQQYNGVTRVFSPQFAITRTFQTTLNLINGNLDSDAVVVLTLHGPDGKVLGTPVAQALDRSAQLKDDLRNIFHNDPAIQNTTGWLEVISNVPGITGTVTFADPNNTFMATFALSGTPLTHFLFPMASEDGVYQTAMALLNSGDQAAHVQVELWGEAGTLDRSATLTIAPKSRTAQYLSDLFPGLPPRLLGNIRILSDQPLHGFSILNDRSLNFLCAVPPIALP